MVVRFLKCSDQRLHRTVNYNQHHSDNGICKSCNHTGCDSLHIVRYSWCLMMSDFISLKRYSWCRLTIVLAVYRSVCKILESRHDKTHLIFTKLKAPDRCAQLLFANVTWSQTNTQRSWSVFQKLERKQTNGRTDGWTDGQTDGRTLPNVLSPLLRGR